jgi:hypothetical protein
MPDSRPSELGTRLLQHDSTLNSPRYEEYRMELERKLTQAERREKLAHRVALGALVTAVISGALCMSQVAGSADFGDSSATPLSIAITILYILSLAVFGVGFASYYSRFRPAVRQAREQLVLESIRDLRIEVRELRQKVEARSSNNA